jgi:MFS family permease
VLVPALGREALGLSEAQRGTLMSAFGAGLIVGGVASGALMRFARRGALILAATAGTALVIAAVPAAPGALAMGACLGAAGMLAGVVAALIPATLQSATPDAYRGRVMSLQAMILGGFPAVGAMLAGGLAETIGVRSSIHAAGLVGAAAVAAMAAAFPVLRGVRSPRPDAAAGGAAPALEPTRES